MRLGLGTNDTRTTIQHACTVRFSGVRIDQTCTAAANNVTVGIVSLETCYLIVCKLLIVQIRHSLTLIVASP